MSQTVEETQDNKSKKVKALLAGGLVLGVGAAITLAAWTDQEWAEGIFGTGSFNIEASTTGGETSFTDHPSEDEAAVLDFELGADNLTPEDTVAAPFVLRLDDETTYDAEVSLTSASAAGANADNFTYGIVEVDSADECTADATGTTIVDNATFTSDVAENSFTLTAGAEGKAGEAATLCFQVSAGETLELGENTTATWQLVGTTQN